MQGKWVYIGGEADLERLDHRVADGERGAELGVLHLAPRQLGREAVKIVPLRGKRRHRGRGRPLRGGKRGWGRSRDRRATRLARSAEGKF